ncbi:MAG: hypothetical protein CSA86_01070 [Arcobacter sp.]|nr:MAG: hypothetical protein CSA86_01070 [Arcobacter sp.]
MNNIKKNILILGFSSILVACSQSEPVVFHKEPLYGQNLQYSKVLKVIQDDEVKAIFTITYLNSSNSEKWNNGKQNFLIGTYLVDETDTNFKLTMNNKKQVSSQEISKDDPLYKGIAFRNNWAKYTIVTFDNLKDKTVTLQYTHPKFKTISTTFTKE